MFIISRVDCLLGTIILIYIHALFECRAQGTKQTRMCKHSKSHLPNVKVSAVIKGVLFLQLPHIRGQTWFGFEMYDTVDARGNRLFLFTYCFVQNRNLSILIEYFCSTITAEVGWVINTWTINVFILDNRYMCWFRTVNIMNLFLISSLSFPNLGFPNLLFSGQKNSVLCIWLKKSLKVEKHFLIF